jgi:hypothetical protein
MKRSPILVALLSTCWIGCSSTTDPDSGSQTHFLDDCDSSCATPYECLCGVCTLACDEDQACSGQPANAACLGGSACSGSAMVCDVECTRDEQCTALGTAFTCEAGRCRESTTDEVPPDAMAVESICDGSTDIRLGLSTEGGFVDQSYSVTNPLGGTFLYVDGQCRFYASNDFRRGTFSGTFAEAAEQQLASDIAWQMLAELAAAPEVQSCFDAGSAVIWAPGHRASCTCGCDECAVQAQKEAAISQIYPVVQTAIDMGEALTGGIIAVAQETGPANGSEAVWPLFSVITEVPNLVQDFTNGSPTTGARFDDEEAAALRSLRSDDPTAPPLQVQQGDVAYLLYMRDAFPDGVEEAIRAFRSNAEMAP